ncbi:MAG: geranylgeranyl pyrophosphate synthase [Candidatus Hydrogenedentota bacterium]
MQTALTLQELYRPVEREMAEVRKAVAGLWHDALKLVHGSSIPEPPIGGKMLRPALCLLSAGAIGAANVADYVPMATAMELLHLAALAHDDVIDGADLRHGDASLNARWDNHTAVLGGDYLVARSIGLLSRYDSCGVIVNAIESVRMMAEGELNHFGLAQNQYTEAACISLARQKTASLFAVTCSTPSVHISGTPMQNLNDYGMNIGVAFQLVDDLLDLSQNRDALGKPSCGDLIEGKKTLPVIYMREAMDDAGVARIDAMKHAKLSDADRTWVAETLESTRARERVESISREYIEEGRAAISSLPASSYKDAMMGIAEFILVRGN